MAKKISYKFLSAEISRGTEENPELRQVFVDKKLICRTDAQYEAALLTAKKEAYNGDYTIEDDGVEEVAHPTQEERIAELEAALELLLSGVTE